MIGRNVTERYRVTELTAISANGQQVSHEFSWQILRRPLDLTPNIFFVFFFWKQILRAAQTPVLGTLLRSIIITN